MARRTQIALTAALVLMAGCGVPVYHLKVEDLSQGGPADPSRVLVGRDVVVRVVDSRVQRDGYARTKVDVFPVGAVLRGAWVKRLVDGEICEGPLGLYYTVNEYYELLWRGGQDLRCTPALPTERVSMTLWLGPVCLRDACETFRIVSPD